MFLYNSNNKLIPDLENAQDGDEHIDYGYFKLNNLPIESNTQLHGIIEKILK